LNFKKIIAKPQFYYVNEEEALLLQRDRAMLQNLVSIRSLPSEILRFYDFASLAGKCLTLFGFGG